MSDDWKVGDLALCVRNSHAELGYTKRLRIGAVYTVDSYYVSSVCGSLALVLKGVQPAKNPGFHAFLFRKIHPHQADEFDREVIEQMTGDEVPA